MGTTCDVLPANTAIGPGWEYARTRVYSGCQYRWNTCSSNFDTQLTLFQANNTTTPVAVNNNNGPECTGTQASINIVPGFNDYIRWQVHRFNCATSTTSAQVRVRQLNNLSMTFSAADMCEGAVRTLTATPAASPTTLSGAGNRGTFTGTGVAGTNFTAPAQTTQQSTTYTISYTKGFCSTTRAIRVFNNPTPANAGSDQTVCSTTYNTTASTPVIGTGTWTVISGSGTFANANDPTTTISGLGAGVNQFRWTVGNGPCTTSADDLFITRDVAPTVANAGPDQTVCISGVTLAGNTATVGTGVWTLVSGAGTITNPSSPTTTVTNIGSGTNIFRWTITNGSCPPSIDEVVVTTDVAPTPANAGPDQTVCGSSTTLAARVPFVGTGTWSVVSGSGTFANVNASNSAVSGLSLGANVFRWTTANGVCPSSTDLVTITRIADPTPSNAGPDQTVCADTTTLAGNAPSSGLGTWSVASGSGTLLNANAANSSISGLGIGANTFVWTISNGSCPTSTDSVTITRDDIPTVANAGPDQTVCDTVATLAANTPAVGTGTWTVVSGSGTFSNANAANSTVSGLSVGTNTFLWTISNGACPSSSDSVVITRDDFPTVANAGPDQTICDTVTTLAANTPAVGTGSWTVVSGSGTFSNASTPNSMVSGLGAGANTFVWSISNGVCTPSVDSVTITRDDFPTVANAGPDQTVCDTVATLAGNTAVVGTGTWFKLSGTGTITSPNAPNTTITGLGVGTSVWIWTIQNGSCPPSIDTVSISRDDFPTVANAGPDQTVCDTLATLAANTAVVGTGTWFRLSGTGTITSPNAPNTTITGLGVGTSVWLWTIQNGSCPPSIDTLRITRDDFPTLANAGADTTVCDSSFTLSGNSAVVGMGMWSLVSGSGTITSPGSANSSVTGLGVGANTFVWTISNGVCVSSSDTVVVSRDDFPSLANAGADTTVCDSSFTLGGNSAVVGMGMWSLASGSGTITSPGSANSAVSGLGVGANTFVWTISNGVCASTEDSVNIVRDDFPTIASAGTDTAICDTFYMMMANAPTVGTGVWSLVSGTGTPSNAADPNAVVSNLGVGANTFVWTISNGVCNSSSDTVVITRNALPTLSVVGDSAECAGQTFVLEAFSNASLPLYRWLDKGGNNVSNNKIYTTPPLTQTDTFFVFVIDSLTGCQSETVEVPLIVYQPAAINLGPDTDLCIGDSITLDAGTTGVSYLWIPTGDSTQTITVSTAGLYGVAVTDSNGCVVGDTVSIGVNPLPVVNLGPDTAICPTDTLVLDAGAGFTVYNWSNGDSTQTAAFAAPGTHSVAVTDSNGCTNSDSMVLSQLQLPDSIITLSGPAVACQNDVVMLTADTGYVSYRWSNGDSSRMTNVTAPTATYFVVATDGRGCLVTDSIEASFLNRPNPNPMITPPNPVNVCVGDTVSLDAGSGFASYLWSSGDVTQMIELTSGGMFSVSVTDTAGCAGSSDTVNVTFNPLPVPFITQSGDTLFAQPSNLSSYQWLRNNNPIPGATNNFFLPTENGTYCVIVADANGCEGDTCLIFVANAEPVSGDQLYGLRIYPNPTAGNLNLSTLRPIKSPLEVSIFDMVGHEVRTYHFEHLIDAVQLDMSLIADGMYLMKVRSGNKSTIFRIVKEN